MIIFKNELGEVLETSPKNGVPRDENNDPVFRTDAKTAEIGQYENGVWTSTDTITNADFVPIDVEKLKLEIKEKIQKKTEEIIDSLTFIHPSDSTKVFSASLSASDLWDKLNAKKNTSGFFPRAKTLVNDEIYQIQDLSEFDSLTNALFSTQEPVYMQSAGLKLAVNSMTLVELSQWEDPR